MNKILFKKAQSFVDALRVRFDSILGTALVYMVYALALEAEAETYSAWDNEREFIPLASQLINQYGEKIIAVLVDTLDHFDHLFEVGHQNHEVYLGRDGVYPYLARRAQLVLRRKKGLTVPKATYLVFNSRHRDNRHMPRKMALRYFEQFGLTPDTHQGVVYYDTGFTGTIPIKIMNLLGIPSSEMDRHIRLTCYSTKMEHERNIPIWEQIKWFSEFSSEYNLRNYFGTFLEDIAKSEKTADRELVELPSGRIVHTADPVPNKEKRLWKFLRAFLVAYFYQREKSLLDNPHRQGSAWVSGFHRIIGGQKCGNCNAVYNPLLEGNDHQTTCTKCWGTYCKSHDHTTKTCLLCGEDHCAGMAYLHNKQCFHCTKMVCEGNHYTKYCYRHGGGAYKYCGDEYDAPCPICFGPAETTTIDTSLSWALSEMVSMREFVKSFLSKCKSCGSHSLHSSHLCSCCGGYECSETVSRHRIHCKCCNTVVCGPHKKYSCYSHVVNKAGFYRHFEYCGQDFCPMCEDDADMSTRDTSLSLVFQQAYQTLAGSFANREECSVCKDNAIHKPRQCRNCGVDTCNGDTSLHNIHCWECDEWFCGDYSTHSAGHPEEEEYDYIDEYEYEYD